MSGNAGNDWSRLQREIERKAPKVRRAEAKRFSSELWITRSFICGGCNREFEAEFKDGKVPPWYRCSECFARKRGRRLSL